MLSKIGLIYVPFQDAYTCIICMTNLLICALLRRIFVSIFFFTKKKYCPKKPREISKIICAWLRWISVGDVFFYFQPKKINTTKELKISKTIIESTLLYWIELDCTFLQLKMNTRFFKCLYHNVLLMNWFFSFYTSLVLIVS